MEPTAVIGHISIDRIITRSGERHQLGGSPTYISLITHLLGVPLIVVTKIGGDFPADYLKELADRGLDASSSVVSSMKTTRFVLDYTGTTQRFGYDSVCASIDPLDLIGLPEATIIAPIVHEIPRETINALKSQILAADPQGFVRELGPGGTIHLQPWLDKGLIRRLSLFKASERELGLIAGNEGWKGLDKIAKLGAKVIIETRGGEGARIQHPGGRMLVPAYAVDTIDTTGAGDGFIAGFFTAYVSGESIEWCAAVGSAAASAIVETIGPRIVIGKQELFERAEKVLEGISKLA